MSMIDLVSKHDNSPSVVATYLFVAFDGNHPRQSTFRYRLSGIDEILIGRAKRRETSLEDKGRSTRLILRFPDPWMSTEHAVIRTGARGLELVDSGSTNGSFVNGTGQQSAVLTDGDLLQLGRTFFVLREALPGRGDEPAHLCPDMNAPPGLLTLLPPLEQGFVEFARVASGHGPLVIVGAHGTGKSTLAQTARAIADLPGPFVHLQPAGMPVSEIERRLAACAAGPEGTLLIDGLESMPPATHLAVCDMLQVALSRVSHGEGAPRAGGVQCIVTCTRPLEDLGLGDVLSSELVARLSGYTLTLPPLHQRREDMGLLVASMLGRYAGGREIAFTAEAVTAILRYPWPRNLRELESTIGTALALCDEDTIDVGHLPPELHRPMAWSREAGGDTVDTIELSEQAIQRRAEILASMRTRNNYQAAESDLQTIRQQFQAWLALRQAQAAQEG